MITNKQREWLSKPEKERQREWEHMTAIQKQIDKSMENALWLAKNHPEILLNERINIRHKRIQQLLLLIQILKPEMNIYLEVAEDIEKTQV